MKFRFLKVSIFFDILNPCGFDGIVIESLWVQKAPLLQTYIHFADFNHILLYVVFHTFNDTMVL